MFIGLIAIVWWIFGLTKRVDKLEGALRAQQMPIQAPVVSQTLPAGATEVMAAPVKPENISPQETLPEDGWIEKFANWAKEDWLLKLGALLLLIGFGWLATFAVINNWIGEIGRITLGIMAGSLLILLGWWRIQRYIHQGSIFLVLGSTIVLLTVFAARELYGFFTPASSLGIMFLSVVFVALASVRYRIFSLALLSLLLAGIVPLLTNSSGSNEIGLFSYLFIVTLGAIWIVAVTGWRSLTTAALLLVALYSAPYLVGVSIFGRNQDIVLLFSFAFAALFFITHTLGILKAKGREILFDLATACGNGLFVLAWIMTGVPQEWQSLSIAAWILVFAVGAFAVFLLTNRKEPFYIYGGVSVAMLAAATAAELKGAPLVIAYSIESGIIVLLVHTLLRDIRVALRSSFVFLGPVLLSFESMVSPAWRQGIFHEHFAALFVLTATILSLGLYFFLQAQGKEKDGEAKVWVILLLVSGSVYAYILLWLSMHAAFGKDYIAVLVSLLVYTVIGLITYFKGGISNSKALRFYGGILLGFVVGRLLLVDVWTMELSWRIITFFAVGALLMSTAFLGRKKREPITPDPINQKQENI